MSEMLRPLQIIDIPRIYAQNAVVIDFVLYLVLFNGLAQVALARRLDGKGGRLVAGAVGSNAGNSSADGPAGAGSKMSQKPSYGRKVMETTGPVADGVKGRGVRAPDSQSHFTGSPSQPAKANASPSGSSARQRMVTVSC